MTCSGVPVSHDKFVLMRTSESNDNDNDIDNYSSSSSSSSSSSTTTTTTTTTPIIMIVTILSSRSQRIGKGQMGSALMGSLRIWCFLTEGPSG